MENGIFTAPIPKKIVIKQNLGHTGNILFNIGVILFIIAVLLILSPIAYGLFAMVLFMFLIIAAVFTLGTIILSNTYRALWNFASFYDKTIMLANIGSYLLLTGSVLLITSTIFLFLNNKKSVSRLVVSYILGVLGIAIFAFLKLGGAS